MIGDEADLGVARARADIARKKLAITLSEIQERLNPRVLIRDAWDEVRTHGGEVAQDAIKSVKERPGRAAAIGGALALLLARKPIANAIGGLLLPSDKDDTAGADETSPPADGFVTEQSARALPGPSTSGDSA